MKPMMNYHLPTHPSTFLPAQSPEPTSTLKHIVMVQDIQNIDMPPLIESPSFRSNYSRKELPSPSKTSKKKELNIDMSEVMLET